MTDREIIERAVALLQALGKKPSIRVVDAVIKCAHGKRGLRWATIAEVLKVLPGNTSGNSTTTLEQQNDEEQATVGQQSGTPTRGRADHNGISIVSRNLDVSPSSSVAIAPSSIPPTPALTLVAVPSKPKTIRQPRLDTRTAAEQTADEALGQLRGTIEPDLRGITWSKWLRRQNRRITVELAESGMTVEEILEAHTATSEAIGATAVFMSRVQREVLQGEQPAREFGRRDPEQEFIDNLPRLADLDLGPIIIPPWERPPGHPKYAPRPSA